MNLEQITDASAEPITLAQAKSWLREDLVSVENDTDISDLISAARRHAEGFLGRCIKAQSFEFSLDGWPGRDYIQLPRYKSTSVTVTYRDSAENLQTLSAGDYVLDAKAARVALRFGKSWPSTILSPSGAILVAFAAGDNSKPYPEGIRLFTRQAVAHWYRNRESVTLGNSAVDSKLLEMGAYQLLLNDPGKFRQYA